MSKNKDPVNSNTTDDSTKTQGANSPSDQGGNQTPAADVTLSGLNFFDLELLEPSAKKYLYDCQQLLDSKLDLKLTCLGCYRSENSWDYRPLFVVKSDLRNLLLFRIMKPGTKLNPSLEMAWRNLTENLPQTYLASGLDDFSRSTSDSRIYWSLRKFYPKTLNQLQAADIKYNNKADLVKSIEALLAEIELIDGLLCPHGNLTASNLGFDGQKLSLLDPWIFSSFRKTESKDSSSQTLGPRSLASLLLKHFSSYMPEYGSQSLIKFISSESDNLTFSDLHSQWQAVYSKAIESSDHLQTAIINTGNSNEKALLAPRGKVISPTMTSGSATPNLANSSSSNSNPASDFATEITARQTIQSANSKSLRIPNIPALLQFNKRSLLFFGIASISAILVLFISGYLNFNFSAYSDQQLSADWESQSPEKIKQLAKSAIEDNDLKVQQFISMQLLNGNQKAGSDANFLKIAFDPLWFDQLSKLDRLFALSIALSAIYQTPSELLPDVEQLHPALIFALLGKLKLSNVDNSLTKINIEKITDLPGSFGAVFKGLKNLGFSRVGDPAVHAAARVISNNFEASDIQILLNSNENENFVLKVMALVAPFSESNPKIAAQIFEQASPRSDQLGIQLRWFIEEPLADWKSVVPKDLLFIALGLVPDDLNQLDKLADLLLYPNQRVRQKALEKVIASLKAPELNDLFNMLVVTPTILTRAQAVSLVAINQGAPEKAAPFVASWLNLAPDPAVVLEFLLSTRDRKSFESSTVQLANYLARKDFDISQRQLPLLLSHPEALARTLAFPRLDPSRELDRRILTAWLQTETSPRIKQEIKNKLESK